MTILLLLTLVGFLAGGVGAIAGFGIGSLLIPVVALKIGLGMAVAVVSIAHFLGTSLRFAMWWRHVNRKVLFSFGLTSALGGLLGAFLHNQLYNNFLTVIFGFLLVIQGLAGISGFSQRLKFRGVWVYLLGVLSGFFGGLVGNQGGIRSAALFDFDLEQREFVATATGIALIVDLIRVPVYILTQGRQMAQFKREIALSSLAVIAGTIVGGYILKRISQIAFKETMSLILLLIGATILIQDLMISFD